MFISGATEGNGSLCNIEDKVGAVGFVPKAVPAWLADLILPVYVIRVDKDTREPLRDPTTGLCQVAEPGEEGELIGKIVRGDPVKDFTGYKDASLNSSKVLHNVFVRGDSFFRSGDWMMMDEFGWIYFRDRLGDTFR